MTNIKDVGLGQSPAASGKAKISRTEGNRKSGKESEKPQVEQDSVTITTTAGQMAGIEQTLENVPVVDAEKVTEIRTAVEDGSYQIDSEKVAKNIIKTEIEMQQAGKRK